jgi:hypothetical protein
MLRLPVRKSPVESVWLPGEDECFAPALLRAAEENVYSYQSKCFSHLEQPYTV